MKHLGSLILLNLLVMFPCLAQKLMVNHQKCSLTDGNYQNLLYQKETSCNPFQATFGVQGGTFISNLKLNGTSHISNGYSGGLYMNIPLNARWNLRPEFNLQMRRAMYSNHNLNPNETFRASYKYLDIPVLFQRDYKNGLSYFIGPQFGKGLNASYKNRDNQKVELSTIENQEYYDVVTNATEFSIVSGIRYTFDFGLGIDLKYQRSMASFNQGNHIQGMRFSMLEVGLAYNLPCRSR